MAALLLASAFGLLAMGPVVLATPRGWMLSPWIAATALPGLAVSVWGWRRAALASHQECRRGWRAFFGLGVAAAILCALEHLLPSEASWRLARMATGSGCAVLAMLFLAERLGRGWIAPRVLMAGMAAGPVAVLVGLAAQAVHGQVDDRLLLWLDCLPLLLVPLGVWGLPSRGLRGSDWFAALAFFCAAKLFEVFSDELRSATSGGVSGHALYQLMLAASVGCLAWALVRQRVLHAEPGPAPALTP